MENITHSVSAVGRNRKSFAVTTGRLAVMLLLVSAVISVALPGPVTTQAESQPVYAQSSFSAGTKPTAAKIGDLDGDGLNDIAVVNLQGSLRLFFNNGAGSFSPVSFSGLWPSTASTLGVDIGDLNGDGLNDLAVAFSTKTGSVSVLFNKGGRTFSTPVNYNSCNFSNGVAIGDLDRDGDNDLADISRCSKAGILLNGGQGSFTFNGAYGDGDASKSIVLADFNRDGFKDIAYVNSQLFGVTVLLNNRNASFGQPIWYYGGAMPEDLTVGDLDGNGALDLAIADPYYSQVFILFDGGDASFDYGYSEIYGGDTPNSIASGDLNGDGLLDLAVTSSGTGLLSILINRGNYNFADPVAYYVGQNPVDVEIGNLDGDSLPDIVVVNQSSGTITVLSSAGGTLPPPPPAAITLTVSSRATKTGKVVDLKWSGATSSSVDIYRNGSRLATVSNSGSYTDQLGKRAAGTYTYRVCAPDGNCSNTASVSF